MTKKIIYSDGTTMIIEYSTRKEMNKDELVYVDLKFRALHTDFINNREKDGFRVTFVTGKDDPDNSVKSVQSRVKFVRQKVLNKKQETEDLTIQELNELRRLEKGL